MRICCFFMLLAASLQAQVMWQVQTDTVQKWFYMDGDEFNSYSLMLDKWHYGMPWGNMVMSQDLCFTNDNVVQSNGMVSFIAKQEKKNAPVQPYEIDKAYLAKTGKQVVDGHYETDYTCGMISSLKKYKYGYFELRFKSNDNRGIWPAFWLYGGQPNEEIDFFELKGERRNQVHVDVHCPNGCDNYRGGFLNLQKNWGGWVNAKDNLADGWNIISGEWQPGYVKWFLNGEPIAYFKGDFKTAQNLFLNTSVAKNDGGFSPGPDDTTQWPNSFDVDYVRIWSREDTVVSRPKNDYTVFEKSTGTVDSLNLYKTSLKKKLKYVYNNKALCNDLGTVTLLPLGISKFGLSFEGKDLGPMKVEIYNRQQEKQMGVTLENMKYYILDLPGLPSGMYTVVVHIKGRRLVQEVPVIDPKTMPQY